MKLYIIVDTNTKDKVRWYNLEGSVDYEVLEDILTAYHVKSIKAFTKKKYAKEYIREKEMEKYWTVRAVEVL